MTRRHSSKYAVCRSCTSSWSRLSANAVKPTRSPNSTLVTRRATAGLPGVAVGVVEVAVATPHDQQNRAPGTRVSPQDEQFGEPCVAPQVKQNRAPSGSDSPQLVQVFTA